MKKILFVCLGNICRSPIAHGIAQYLSTQNNLSLYIDSAGTSGFHKGESPHHKSIWVSNKYGIDITKQKSRPLNEDDKEFDYVIAMDDANIKDLSHMGFEHIIKLGDYGLNGADIIDPYYLPGDEGFEKVFSDVNIALEEFFKKEFDLT
ncbi:MAG: Low molecular weight protein tyrosine phosphatase (EC [uncultured Campylobacterales bacterium]|uniref:protein-tyrosine-phosphatase n=1 Tax=uncultured Campylobacterales bacterium TaxID=352960 RepID=A0A6S6SQ86_9BACT|nr:MAG: Low molecular weight protein tyrosine phosphatase (EC [uncultured Campylobacterales bacterium]